MYFRDSSPKNRLIITVAMRFAALREAYSMPKTVNYSPLFDQHDGQMYRRYEMRRNERPMILSEYPSHEKQRPW